MKNKNHEIKIRCTENLFRKLLAICEVTGKTKTSIIEDLILIEYAKNKKYEEKFYEHFKKDIESVG